MKYYLYGVGLMSILSACGGGGGGDNSEVDENSAQINYTQVERLGAEVNQAMAVDGGAQVSANGLELYFFSDRSGGVGGMDLYVAKRDTVDQDWQEAQNLGNMVNSGANDRNASLTSDGLTLYFSSFRAGGEGESDIYRCERASLESEWGIPQNLGTVVNSEYIESGPSVSADNLSLYFHSNRPDSLGDNDLYVSTRLSIDDPWGEPVNIQVLNTSAFEQAPSIASDGLSIYFHSTRPGGSGGYDIWRSTRDSIDDEWSVPEVLASPVNSFSHDLQPGLSFDWQALYFSSDISGDRDIWVATP